jgi:ADP-heptose:LPS heptosyltransferase
MLFNTLFNRYAKKLVKHILWWPASPQVTYFCGEFFFKLLGMRQNTCNISKINLFEIKKVLIVRLDEIGDVVLTTPLFRELRRNLPNAWITLVVKPEVYNLVQNCPYVNEVLTYDWKVPKLLKPLHRHWRALCLARKSLWKRRFDLAILPRWDADDYHATFLVYFSGAPLRVGYSERVNPKKQEFNKGFDSLLTHVLVDNSLKHEVERNLDILSFMGCKIQEKHLELWLSEEDEIFAKDILMNHKYGGEVLIAMGIGAGIANRKWPLKLYIELGDWLIKEYNAKILIVGGSKEKELGLIFKQVVGSGVINVAGITTLRRTAALLKRCHLYIGNDSGPMHIAAAVGTPVVELSCHPITGSIDEINSPFRFGPWGVKKIVIQPKEPLPPCEERCIVYDKPHCILGITVDQVKQAVVDLLANLE